MSISFSCLAKVRAITKDDFSSEKGTSSAAAKGAHCLGASLVEVRPPDGVVPSHGGFI